MKDGVEPGGLNSKVGALETFIAPNGFGGAVSAAFGFCSATGAGVGAGLAGCGAGAF